MRTAALIRKLKVKMCYCDLEMCYLIILFVDTMEDIWPTAERFDFNKLRDRYNCKTPPFTHTPAEAEPIPMFIRFEDYILPPEKDVIEIPMHHE